MGLAAHARCGAVLARAGVQVRRPTAEDVLREFVAWKAEPAIDCAFDDECAREFARRYVAARLDDKHGASARTPPRRLGNL